MDVRKERYESNLFAGKTLSIDALSRWDNCKSSHRFLAYKGKRLVIYKLWFGEPNIIETLTCIGANLSLTNGLSSTWARASGDSLILISHAPTEIHTSCFMWHVFDNNIRYAEYNSGYSLSLPLAYKTESNPHTTADENHTYVMEKTIFDTTVWAGVK